MIESTRGHFLRVAQAVCCIALALFMLSCSEEPTDQNSPSAPVPLPGVEIRDTTIYAVRDSTFKVHIPMDGNNNLVGSTDGYTAMSVLEFYPSSFTLRDTVNVLSAKLTLRLSYSLGTTPGLFAFDVYRVTHTWSASTLRWDSVQTGFYDASTKRGTFSATVSSDTGFITIDLDTAMVREWISSTAAAESKYGIILIPTPSSAVRGFVNYGTGDSSSYYPSLEIIAAGTSGATKDTTKYTVSTGTFVADVTLPTDPTVLNVQAGVVYRSKLVFDVSFIPRGTVINSAILSVDVVPTATRLTSFSADTNVSAHLDLGDDPSYLESVGVILLPTSQPLVTMSGDISHAVQSWVRGPNYGLVIRNSFPAENSRLDLFGFSGVRAPSAATRPRIKITYSLGKY